MEWEEEQGRSPLIVQIPPDDTPPDSSLYSPLPKVNERRAFLPVPPFVAFCVVTLMTLGSYAMQTVIIFPMLEELVKDEHPQEQHQTDKQYKDWISDMASHYTMQMTFLNGAMSFLMSPVFGYVSDRVGRKPVLLMTILAIAGDGLFFIFASEIWLLMIGKALSGMFNCLFVVVYAQVADISSRESRAQYFGYLMGSIGLAMSIFPLIGGLIAKEGTVYAFASASCLGGVSFLFALLCVPETKDPSSNIDLRNPFVRIIEPFTKFGMIARSKYVLGMCVLLEIETLCSDCVMAVTQPFTSWKFGFGSVEFGILIGAIGLSMALVQGFGVKWAVARFGPRQVIIFAVFMSSFGLVGYGVAPTPVVLFCTATLRSFALLSVPLLNGLISAEFTMAEQGAIMGVVAGMKQLCQFIGPLSNEVFRYFAFHCDWLYAPGMIFYILGGLNLISMPIALTLKFPDRIERKDERKDEVEVEQVLEPSMVGASGIQEA